MTRFLDLYHENGSFHVFQHIYACYFQEKPYLCNVVVKLLIKLIIIFFKVLSNKVKLEKVLDLGK